MTRRRARVVAAGVALALVVTLAACGDDPSDEGEPAGGGTTAAEGGEGAESTEAAGTTVGESAATTETASTTGGSSSSAAASTATTAAPGPAGEVAVADFAFDPEELEVTVGGTVTWTNEDDFAHEIVATDSENPFPGEGEIDNGETYTVTFAEIGTYDYFCGIHNSMTGSIVVV